MFLRHYPSVSKIEAELIQFKKKITSNSRSVAFALTNDGQTIDTSLNENLAGFFRDICMSCQAVLCCRTSPNQKAQVVKLVKESPLCIHDPGGSCRQRNLWQRGTSLLTCFALGKFKFLKRILIVHGYLYYTQPASMVLFFIYMVSSFDNCFGPLYIWTL